MIVYILIVLIAICWGTGGSMQKHGMASEFPKLGLRTLAKDWRKILRALLANKVWVGGFIVMGLGGALFVYSTSIGDISVIQPLTNINGVVAVLIGVLILKERIRSVEAAGVLLLIGGAIVVGFSSEASTAEAVNEGMLLVLTIATVLVLIIGFILFGMGSKLGGGGWASLIMAFIAGISFGLTNLFVKVLTESSKGGGDAMRISTEVLIEFLTAYHIYVLLIFLLVGSVAYQLACSHGRVAVVQPMTTVFSNVLPVAGGWLAFGEDMGVGKLAGIGIILVGTVMLMLGKPDGGGGGDPMPESEPGTGQDGEAK